MSEFILDRAINTRICGKSPVKAFVRVNEWTWNHLPASLTAVRPVRSCGRMLHGLVCRLEGRKQYFGTFFLRNRPQLELIRRLADQTAQGATLKIAVLGCSNGAEVYSVLATIRSARPDLKIITDAADISKEVLELAKNGTYSWTSPEMVEEPIFERMTEEEIQKIFDRDGEHVHVKPWIKEGIAWHLGDVANPDILEVLERQDIVVANNFLCHMHPPQAERCLRHVARLVKPGGYLFASGIDLDIRSKVASDLHWTPVTDLLEDIHDGDPVVRRDWPWRYWGLEPLDKGRNDWRVRYATVFQLGEQS